MRKLIIAAIAATVAAFSFIADAEARGRGAHWHNHGWNHHGGWRGHRHGWYGHGGHGGYWGPGWGFWGGPTIIIGGPGYYDNTCYVRRVRHHDRHGNVYIKRVRVCE